MATLPFLFAACSGDDSNPHIDEPSSSSIDISSSSQTTTVYWDGSSVDTEWYDVDESEFTITTAAQLAGLAKLVNEDDQNFEGKTVKLGVNIMLNSDTTNWKSWENTPPANTWTQIGTNLYSRNRFTGTFDGNNNVISGVYMDYAAVSAPASYKGLFGVVARYGKIENLGIKASFIRGYNFVGGLVGESDGEINNCYFIGTVRSYSWAGGTGGHLGGLVGSSGVGYGKISNSYSMGTVAASAELSGVGGNVGGLVGSNSCEISNSYSTSNVSSLGDNVGGLIGSNSFGYVTIKNSYATGTVSGGSRVGGLIGGNNSPIEYSYATGAVSSAGAEIGGLVGYNVSATIKHSYSAGAVSSTGTSVGGFLGRNNGGGIVSDSYYDIEASGQSEAVGLISNGTVDVEGKSTADMQKKETYEGWDFNTIWNIGSGYPYLR